MSWIHEADVQLPNVIKSMSINPKAMEAVQGLNRAITFGASEYRRRPSPPPSPWPTAAAIEPWLTEGSSVNIPMTRNW